MRYLDATGRNAIYNWVGTASQASTALSVDRYDGGAYFPTGEGREHTKF